MLTYELAGELDLFAWFEESMTSGDTPPDHQLRRVAVQMAAALAHVHEHGYVHHDFKAENVMVAYTPSGAINTKLIDFGLAAACDRHPGYTGTRSSAAPEMWRPSEYEGSAADVWSFGGAPLAPPYARRASACLTLSSDRGDFARVRMPCAQ